MRNRSLFAFAVLALGLPLRAEVVPNGLFADNMVLQQGKPVPVWGTAELGEVVTVTLGSQRVSATAVDGNWMVHLEPLAAGGPYELTIAGTNSITLKNVLVGEVWLCSGQSNMAWSLGNAFEAEKHVAASADSRLRLVTVPRAAAIEPLKSVKLQWSEANPQTTPGFSAVGYFFGKHLREALRVPVGLISTNVGGTPAEAWTSYGTLFMDPELRPITKGFEQALAVWPAKMKEYREVTLPKWQEAVTAAKAAGKTPPRQPSPPMGPTHQSRPAGLYNAMIAPLVPFAIAGAIWYQGESNAGRAKQYQTLFPTMISDWRRAFGQGDFPFLFVQLAPFMAIKPEPSESSWAELREAQLMTLDLPKTGMAVITDVGEEQDIHPRKKEPVGRRLALAALTMQYGWKCESSGPTFKRMVVQDGQAWLEFSHVDGGLVVKGDKPTGFAIAGADRKWVWAEAEIRGDKVVVWSPQVAEPVAVRYGWADYPVVNLWNRADLPATPFRTDNWPRP